MFLKSLKRLRLLREFPESGLIESRRFYAVENEKHTGDIVAK